MLVGYGIGRRGSPPAPDRVASAEKGWRGETSTPPAHPGVGDRMVGGAAGTDAEAPSGALEDTTVAAGAPVTRFRDFQITASSWELAHPPQLAADGDPYSFWHAWKTERFHNAEWLTITFPTERVITRIGLLPGRMGPGARAEGRVRSLLVKSAGALPEKLIFADRPQLQYRSLPKPLRTRKLVLRIGTVLPGTETHHILIPEIQVWGRRLSSPLAQRNGE